MTNAQIADQLSLTARLMDIHGENAFKVKTYSIAAYHIERMAVPLAETNRKRMAAIKGIGASVAENIAELLDTGSLKKLQSLIAHTPPGVMEMMQLKGLGPKKIHAIWKEMGIHTIGELEYACNENRLTHFKGFGAKTQANVLEAIRFYNQNVGHFLYAQIEPNIGTITSYLEKVFGSHKVRITGAFRRQNLTMGYLEFVINESNDHIKPKFETAYPPKLMEETAHTLLYKLTNGLRLLLHTGKKNIFNKQFLTSASPEFLESFFEKYPKDIFEAAAPVSEAEIFEERDLPYIAPCLREGKEIIEKAAAGKMPQLIEISDIRGIIHSHSNWSDGANTIEEMAAEAIRNHYEYLVISDHSQTAAYANGLSPERIAEQHRQIDLLNETLKPFKIFKSIESDILNDGSLDYDDEILKSFDLIIASVHSNLYMNEEKAMVRLLKAIENPYTNILGHPTGRLLLSRNGYPIDHKKIIDACVQHGVVIEINANPRRLDLDWSWIGYAISKNALLSINPDAHATSGMQDVKYGVIASQKGALTAAHNLSSFSLQAFERFVAKAKEKRSV